MERSSDTTVRREGSHAVRDAVVVVAFLAVLTTLNVSVETTRAPDATADAAPGPASLVGIPEAVAAEQPRTEQPRTELPRPEPPEVAERDAHADPHADPSCEPRVVRAHCADNGECELDIGDVHVVVHLPNLG